MRHRTADVVTFGEVFHDHQYVPPPAVADALGANGGPRRILDLVANVGYFGVFCAARWPEASITAFEPDPENHAVLERCVAVNARSDRWEVRQAAAAAQDGEAKFVAGLESLSHLEGAEAEGSGAGEGEPHTVVVPTEDVLPRMAASDLVKMDIEGGEWDLLRDPRFAERPPRALVLEYHPHRTVKGEPRAAVERMLEAAGLAVAPIFHRPDGYGMVWAWRAAPPGSPAGE